MTFSVLALDPASGAIGCAAATGNLAVGAWVLRAAATAGAVATQGLSVSSLWGDRGLARLAEGVGPATVLEELTGPDAGRDYRQLTVLDSRGGTAAWTGRQNKDEKGHILGKNYVLAGNWLASASVLREMERAFDGAAESQDMDFGRRLLAALAAAAAAGGDSRGTQSAAIRIVHPEQAPLDLRVDHDDDPVARLGVLYDLATSPPYSEWVNQVPTLADPYRS